LGKPLLGLHSFHCEASKGKAKTRLSSNFAWQGRTCCRIHDVDP